MHFRYEEIIGIELANFPENGRGGNLIGYKIKLKMRVKNMNYVIQQEMKLDYKFTETSLNRLLKSWNRWN